MDDPTLRQMTAGVVALGLTAVALRGLAKTREQDKIHKIQEAQKNMPPERSQRFPYRTLASMVSDINNQGGLELPIAGESATATWYTRMGATTKGGSRVM